MEAIYLLVKVVGVLVPLFAVWQWGKCHAEKKQAEKIAKEKTEDAKINSEPFVSNPFSRMRRKK